MAVDARDRIYCLGEDDSLVYAIDTSGEIVREIIQYDYRKSDNPPSHIVRLQGLHFENKQ